jgi:hypothetical protein
MAWYEARNDSDTERPKLSTLVGHFVGHLCLGTVGFVTLAIPPIILSWAAYYLDETHVSAAVIDVLLGVHYFLLGVDVLVFVAYISLSVYDAARELILYVKSP